MIAVQISGEDGVWLRDGCGIQHVGQAYSVGVFDTVASPSLLCAGLSVATRRTAASTRWRVEDDARCRGRLVMTTGILSPANVDVGIGVLLRACTCT